MIEHCFRAAVHALGNSLAPALRVHQSLSFKTIVRVRSVSDSHAWKDEERLLSFRTQFRILPHRETLPQEWDAEIIEQTPDQRIAWKSVGGPLSFQDL